MIPHFEPIGIDQELMRLEDARPNAAAISRFSNWRW